jgi:L-ribulose-5-phosphate 3-epimerase
MANTVSQHPALQQLGFCSWSVRPESIGELILSSQQIELPAIQLHLNPLCDDGQNWRNSIAQLRDAGIRIISGMFSCVGEDYTTIETIHQTGGVVPDDTWPASFTNLHIIAPLAGALGLDLVTLHAGFIPSDASDPLYAKVTDRMRKVADLLGSYGVGVSLETGQESAATLSAFLQQLDRKNVFINFDPANMLLYGSGDPIAALKLLLPFVRSCHLKDAQRSAKAGEWGSEVPLGTGEVNWSEFFAILAEANFAGPLMIEREAGDQRIIDIRTGVEFARKWLS